MGTVHPAIEPALQEWVERQRMFFVATAPLAADGHVNLSPKGRDSLRILGPRQVAYLDMPGSGVETIAHLRENGRIVLMLCAFDGPPKIVRLHGRGRPVFPGEPEFGGLLAGFPPHPAVRAIILVEVDRVSDSCGFGVPFYEWRGNRTNSEEWIRGVPDERLREYGVRKNQESIDGLPGLDPGEARSVVINRDLVTGNSRQQEPGS
jgi:hypothetical protein